MEPRGAVVVMTAPFSLNGKQLFSRPLSCSSPIYATIKKADHDDQLH